MTGVGTDTGSKQMPPADIIFQPEQFNVSSLQLLLISFMDKIRAGMK